MTPITSTVVTEQHYSLDTLSGKWDLAKETIRRAIQDEPGVIRIRGGAQGKRTRYSIPESVALRIHERLSAV